MKRIRATLVVLAAVAIAACGDKGNREAKAPMTQAQRDSAIAASRLPGAGVVGKALTAADSAAARAKRIDENSGADED